MSLPQAIRGPHWCGPLPCHCKGRGRVVVASPLEIIVAIAKIAMRVIRETHMKITAAASSTLTACFGLCRGVLRARRVGARQHAPRSGRRARHPRDAGEETVPLVVDARAPCSAHFPWHRDAVGAETDQLRSERPMERSASTRTSRAANNFRNQHRADLNRCPRSCRWWRNGGHCAAWIGPSRFMTTRPGTS
jgi:hypothetical protein